MPTHTYGLLFGDTLDRRRILHQQWPLLDNGIRFLIKLQKPNWNNIWSVRVY